MQQINKEPELLFIPLIVAARCLMCLRGGGGLGEENAFMDVYIAIDDRSLTHHGPFSLSINGATRIGV